MGIGYFQLTVISESDKYIVGNPQMTFFKAVYKRHTNFAFENFILNFTGDTFMGKNSNFGKKMYSVIPKNGDLLHRMYLVIDLEDTNTDFDDDDDSCTTSSLEKLKEKESFKTLTGKNIDLCESDLVFTNGKNVLKTK